MQSVFRFIPMMFSGVEVRALVHEALEHQTTELALCTGALSYWNSYSIQTRAKQLRFCDCMWKECSGVHKFWLFSVNIVKNMCQIDH